LSEVHGYYPLFLQIKGKKTLLVGGGRVALRKCRDLRVAGADVRVVATKVCPELKRLKTIELHERAYRKSDMKDVVLVIAATNVSDLNEKIAAEANRLNIPVNVVDIPHLCSFIVPAVLKRGPITVAVSTAGSSPALARNLRMRVADVVTEADGKHAAFLGRARKQVLKKVSDPDKRKVMLDRLAEKDVAKMVSKGYVAKANALVKKLIHDAIN